MPARAIVRSGWNSRLHTRSSHPSGRRFTKRWNASRPPASSTGTASHFRITIRLPSRRDSRSVNKPSAAAKNSGPITRRTRTSSGTSTTTGARASHTCDTTHKQQRCQHDPHADGNNHIEQHGQRHAQQHDDDVIFRCMTQQVDHFVRFTHVPRHHQQQGCHGGKWQPGEQRCQYQQGKNNQNRVDHRRDRGSCPGTDVSGRTRDGSCSGNATKERSDNIPQSLSNQFAVRLVFRPGHTIQHHGAEQRFDCAEHCH